jgi:diguanylate cyclase (GGDEF)-like protein
VIIEIARRIADAIGPGGSSARWGGDEFVVLLTNSAPHLLRATAYAVLASIRDRPVDLPDGSTFAAGVSIGASLMEPDETIETATEMADTALYMAKGEGRNRVVILDPETILRNGKAAS